LWHVNPEVVKDPNMVQYILMLPPYWCLFPLKFLNHNCACYSGSCFSHECEHILFVLVVQITRGKRDRFAETRMAWITLSD
jgi:hypothetical protein